MFAEQFSAVAKSNFEAQVAAASLFQAQALDSVAQLLDLNIRAAKATVEESTATAQQLLAAKDARELLALIAAQAQPSAAKAVAYSRNVATIATAAQSELAKAAEEQAATQAREAAQLVDQLVKNAPPGMEQAAAFLKTALTNASAGYEQINKLSRQTKDAVEKNFANAFTQFAAAGEKAAKSRK